MSGSLHKIMKRKKKDHFPFKGELNTPNEKEYKFLEKSVLGMGNDIYTRSESNVLTDSESDDDSSYKKIKESLPVKKQPAWVDNDDEQTFKESPTKQKSRKKKDENDMKKHQIVMEKRFKEIMGVPKWAQMSENKQKNTDGGLLSRCGEFIKKPKNLNKGFLNIEKVTNLNKATNSEGPVISVLKFHPKSTVAMVAGSAGIVSLFQVDGKENMKLQSLQFQNYPIFSGSFLKNGEELMVGSKYYRYFYNFNLITGQSTKVDNSKVIDITKTKNFCVSPKDDLFAVCGNTGKIYLFAVSSKEFVDSLQMNCKVKALAFSGDGSILYSHGNDGEVYVWDMKSRRCIKKFVDDGCLCGTALASSNNNNFLACGSSSGVVNVYGPEHVDANESVSPLKTFYNLVTPITNVKFNTFGEILAIGSGHKESALKFVHCSSMTVFSNFPPFRCAVKKPISLDFSVNSGFFAVGDHKGSAHLYRLKNYGNY